MAGIFKMDYFFHLTVILISFFQPGISFFNSLGYSGLYKQDTIINKQDFYNGIKWTNNYRNYDVSQFLFSDLFLQGTVTMNKRTFNNVRLKYDILSDEIITPVSLDDIIQLNKEMVDSFSLLFEGEKYGFINIRNDTLDKLSGYMQKLYSGNSTLVVKYKKSFSTSPNANSDGTFTESRTIYLIAEGSFHKLKGTRSLYEALNKNQVDEVKNFMRHNRLKVSRRFPSSFIPVIKYCDTIRQNQTIQR